MVAVRGHHGSLQGLLLGHGARLTVTCQVIQPSMFKELALARIACRRSIKDAVQRVSEIDRPTPPALDTPFARKLIQN
jgi:hypothetical protein